jgi:hypothetical protein
VGNILNKKQLSSKYHCTNPNCGKVFAKPKIIKYYVCPTCQTLVDNFSQTSVIEQSRQNKNSPLKKVNKQPKIEDNILSQLMKEEESVTAAIELAERRESAITAITQFTSTLPISDLENPDTRETTPNELIEVKNYSEQKVEPASPVLLEEPISSSLEEEEEPQSQPQCSRYFGYLRERGKEAQIPEECLACSKAIECMMSTSGLSTKFEEIKKWYVTTE